MGAGRRACRTHPTGAPTCCTKRSATSRQEPSPARLNPVEDSEQLRRGGAILRAYSTPLGAAEQIGQPCRQWTLAMLVSIEGAPPAVNARPVPVLVSQLGNRARRTNRPLASAAWREAGRQEARRGFLLMLPPPHPPDDFIHRSRSAGKRNVFRPGAVWNLAMPPSSRLFPLVVRSCMVAGLAEWHGHTC